MASEVEIANVALTLLGEARIASIDDDVKAAREVKAIFAIARDALQAGYNWHFAKTREKLTALADAPSFGYAYQYQLPTKCLRIIQIADYFPGIDLTDYRGASTEEYQIEGRRILTDFTAPMNFRYVQQVTDTSQFAANFTMMFGAYLAQLLAEPLTQSDQKRARATEQMARELALAVRANAIELPPQKLADDEWLISRL